MGCVRYRVVKPSATSDGTLLITEAQEVLNVSEAHLIFIWDVLSVHDSFIEARDLFSVIVSLFVFGSSESTLLSF